jgi:hypothetical protein
MAWRFATDQQMHPEDRVLVAVMSRPRDFEIARDHGWYRVPEKKATRGVFFEYIAFYFTSAFAEQKYAVHYYARRLGHELVTRRELLPDQPNHPQAKEPYYKLQLGSLRKREPPIVSLRWRRIAFLHTTWDRFEAAREINDLFVESDEFVDRLYHALRETDLAPERQYPVREAGIDYVVDLAIPCRRGVLVLGATGSSSNLPETLRFAPKALRDEREGCLQTIQAEVERRGGPLPLPSASERTVSGTAAEDLPR